MLKNRPSLVSFIMVKVEVMVVHQCRTLQYYENARDKLMGMMYSPEPTRIQPDTPLNEYPGQYHVSPEKAMGLYDLICQDTPPEKIISVMQLQRKDPREVMDIVQGWISKRWHDQQREDHYSGSRMNAILSNYFQSSPVWSTQLQDTELEWEEPYRDHGPDISLSEAPESSIDGSDI